MTGDRIRREPESRGAASRRGVVLVAILLLLASCPGDLRPVRVADGDGDDAEALAAGERDRACPPGLVRCGATCIDPQTSGEFCGASGDCEGSRAGTACAPGRTCAFGACASSCPGGQVLCGGDCVDPQTSGEFCGARGDCRGARSGSACGPRQACAAGACVSNVATLVDLRLSAGTLSPAFAPGTLEYAVRDLPRELSHVQVTPIAADSGATIRISGERVASGAASPPLPLLGGLTVVPIEVTAPGGAKASYTVVIEMPLAPAVASWGSTRGIVDAFGPGVSQSGDVLAVAAHGEGGATAAPGGPVDSAVYVFRRSGTSWVEETAIRAPTPGAAPSFGGSVSLSGDVLAVGPRGAGGAAGYLPGVAGEPGDGGAYVFRRTGTSWVLAAAPKAPCAGAASDTPGFVPGVEGDGAGSVYVFRRAGTSWVLEAHVKVPQTAQLGGTVLLIGDMLTVRPTRGTGQAPSSGGGADMGNGAAEPVSP